MGDEQLRSAIRRAIYNKDRPLPSEVDPDLEADIAAVTPYVEKVCGDLWPGDYDAAKWQPNIVQREVAKRIPREVLTRQEVTVEVVRLALRALAGP